MILILGAGLSGLAASYHIGHSRCLVLEKNDRPFGHIRSHRRDGFTWDTGPHVSFTKNEYVRSLFQSSVACKLQEFEVQVSNYYKGHWIAHPSQTSLHQVPEPLRSECLRSFLRTRNHPGHSEQRPVNYLEWLELAFGSVFSETFPAAYTRKYWTREAAELTTQWIGDRVLYPNIEDVVEGSLRALDHKTHYITKVRYPSQGGFEVFAEGLRAGCNIRYGAEVAAIDLDRKMVWLTDGQCLEYTRLINTLPLPTFINACINVPQHVKDSARRLSCTQLLLVNIGVPHTTIRPETWIYVYDEEKFATRINFTERLAPGNAPIGWTGIQVEVYFSRHRPLSLPPEQVADRVEKEIIEMGIIDPTRFPVSIKSHRHICHSPWANVIFDHDTAPALEIIWSWLEKFGLQRENDDVAPLTQWDKLHNVSESDGTIFMAGRFGQWKYFWTDDCVLRGRQIANQLEDCKKYE